MPDYIPISVAAAEALATEYRKSIVIVLAWDAEHGVLHTTTYGVDPQSKAWAADGGEIAAKALGAMPDQATFYENYRQHCCVRSGHVSVAPDGFNCAAHPNQHQGFGG